MARNNENMTKKLSILNTLDAIEYTHTYGFIIRDEGMVKLAIVEEAGQILPFVTVLEKSAKSKGIDWKVRMWNSKEAFQTIKAYARELVNLQTVEGFESEYQNLKANGYKGNRGDLGEYKAAQALGGTQNESKTAKCTECGDIVVNGEHIQIKLWNATVTTEQTMINLNGILERA